MISLDLIMLMVGTLILIVGVLIGVAFLTLLERKILGYIQIRKGPNKLGLMGLLQPFSDALKLFSKEVIFPFKSNYFSYYFSPVIILVLSLFCWLLMPYLIGFYDFSYGLIFFLCLMSLGVYSVMISGWSSNSNYALLGSLRSVAQTISYEISLALILMSVVFLIFDYNMIKFFVFQQSVWFIFLLFPLSLVWFSSMLAETNRTPFDFAEGESELVSGFNVEYSAGGFALIFLGEYSSILFMSMLFSVFFLGGDVMNLIFYYKLLFISILFIWVRGTLPRYRYDKLMYLCWKYYLSISLGVLMFFISYICYNMWNIFSKN
uniref:NADH dehydrogenase subunit 1 n=1 Tax=Psilochorema bidens TaxID=1968986 RepID=UPI0028D52B22|nr:NADH dehydrogenase subunit 1 [Psilochorema bidens]WMQ76547.1 NADH dehydrogenase subunit 1 [Psilochorema bidens]